MRYSLMCILFALICTGCFEDEKYETLLVLRPAYQQTSSSDFITLEGALAYAFVADTTDFVVASYDDAVLGVAKDAVTGDYLTPIAVGEPYMNDVWDFRGAVSLQVEQEQVLLLVVDTKNEDFAYCNYDVSVNLATTYIAINFPSWSEGIFTYGNWIFNVPEAYVLTTTIPTVVPGDRDSLIEEELEEDEADEDVVDEDVVDEEDITIEELEGDE